MKHLLPLALAALFAGVSQPALQAKPPATPVRHIASRTNAQSQNTGYRQKAEEATDFIQSHFYDAPAQRYRPAFPADPKGLQYDLMWGNGVQYSVLAAAAREDPAKYKTLLYEFTKGLETYWDPQPKGSPPGYNAYCSGPGGTDKYYDDNAWMVLDFAEAYEDTHDKLFLQKADDTQRFVLSGWDNVLGGGIYWKLDHQSKNTCSNSPVAASALRLAQVGGEQDQIGWALKIRDWLNSTLQDKDGLYWDNVNLKGEFGKFKWTYNTALMIRAEVLLFQMRHDPKDLAEARRVADTGLAAWTVPETGSIQGTEGSSRFSVFFCEALLRLYDVTHDLKYLNAVRGHAAFGYRVAHDPDGGWWNEWKTTPSNHDKKDLIENAAPARLFWLLAPYPDGDELYARGMQAAGNHKDAQAVILLRQAADSDVEAVEARFRLWRVLTRLKKTQEAGAESARLTTLAQTPALRSRLEALGWHQP